MSRAFACAALVALGIVSSAGRVSTQGPTQLVRSADARTAPAILTTHPWLQARLNGIARRSGLWREAVGNVARTGRRAIVITSDEVVVAESTFGPAVGAFDDAVLAEIAPVPHHDTRVDVVLVVVNLPLIERIQRRTSALPAEVEGDLDRILVHEVYGHALPYLLAGDLSGRCADPLPGQQAHEACAIQRENAVRAELGLNRRTDYGLHDLTLIRRSWQ